MCVGKHKTIGDMVDAYLLRSVNLKYGTIAKYIGVHENDVASLFHAFRTVYAGLSLMMTPSQIVEVITVYGLRRKSNSSDFDRKVYGREVNKTVIAYFRGFGMKIDEIAKYLNVDKTTVYRKMLPITELVKNGEIGIAIRTCYSEFFEIDNQVIKRIESRFNEINT